MRLLLLNVFVACLASGATAKSGSVDIAKGNSPQNFTDPEVMAYVQANVLSTFYHELGHALIDKMRLPVFAREEDAADTFSVILTDVMHTDETSELIAWASADQYLQLNHKARQYEPNYSDVHSPDLVRFFNTICLYYGADPDLREDFAKENGLPEYRAETCEEERNLAERSWGGVLAKIEHGKVKTGSSDWLVIDSVTESDNRYVRASHKAIQNAIVDLNEKYSPDFKVLVWLTNCNEDNAFYDPNYGAILMCNELIPPFLRRVEGL